MKSGEGGGGGEGNTTNGALTLIITSFPWWSNYPKPDL